MKNLAAGFLGIACFVGICMADGIDDAEAKRRGVAVEVVQLENAKARIAELEKQVADLRAKLVAAAAPTATATAPATMATTVTTIPVKPPVVSGVSARRSGPATPPPAPGFRPD